MRRMRRRRSHRSFRNTVFERQFWRRYCQTFSTGLSSGAREGRKIGVRLSGTSSLLVVCHAALSRMRTGDHPHAGALAEVSFRSSPRVDGRNQDSIATPFALAVHWCIVRQHEKPQQPWRRRTRGPLAEAEISRDDDAGALVELAQQMEEQGPAGGAERQIAKLIEDDEIGAG